MKIWATRVAWILNLSLAQPAVASSDRVAGFRLVACFSRSCVKLVSSEARRSPLDGNFAFLSARLEEWPKTLPAARPLRAWKLSSGVYDPERGDLILRGPKNAYVDLIAGKIHLID